jgi:hypothetical protein
MRPSGQETDAAFRPGLAAVVFGNQPLDSIEDASELFVVAFFQRLYLPSEIAIGVHQAAQLHEGAHNGDIDFRGARSTLESMATPCSVKA